MNTILRPNTQTLDLSKPNLFVLIIILRTTCFLFVSFFGFFIPSPFLRRHFEVPCILLFQAGQNCRVDHFFARQGSEFRRVSIRGEPGHIKNLTDVVRSCRKKGIGVAVSNPCFDLWLLLHFDEFPTDPSLACDEVGQRIRAAVGQYNK